MPATWPEPRGLNRHVGELRDSSESRRDIAPRCREVRGRGVFVPGLVHLSTRWIVAAIAHFARVYPPANLPAFLEEIARPSEALRFADFLPDEGPSHSRRIASVEGRTLRTGRARP